MLSREERSVYIEFYNAGDKIDEVLAYSTQAADRNSNFLARYAFVADRESFVEVPTTIQLKDTDEIIGVQFFRDVTRKWGARGVIKIDPAYNPDKEDQERGVEEYPYARNREEAIVRGREIWHAYLRTVVQRHLDDCESARAAGGSPRSAIGFTKRAMKLLKITDPGEQYFKSLEHGGGGETHSDSRGDGQIEALKTQNAMMLQLMIAIAQGKQVDPAEIAKLAAPETAAKGKPATSGVATGEIKKPLTNVSGVDHELPQHRGKDARRAEAEKALA